MTGAIEFLRKAKVICGTGINCDVCPLVNSCMRAPIHVEDEADLVRKVMDYRLEDKDEPEKRL